jgi:hypothetical protein
MHATMLDELLEARCQQTPVQSLSKCVDLLFGDGVVTDAVNTFKDRINRVGALWQDQYPEGAAVDGGAGEGAAARELLSIICDDLVTFAIEREMVAGLLRCLPDDALNPGLKLVYKQFADHAVSTADVRFLRVLLDDVLRRHGLLHGAQGGGGLGSAVDDLCMAFNPGNRATHRWWAAARVAGAVALGLMDLAGLLTSVWHFGLLKPVTSVVHAVVDVALSRQQREHMRQGAHMYVGRDPLLRAFDRGGPSAQDTTRALVIAAACNLDAFATEAPGTTDVRYLVDFLTGTATPRQLADVLVTTAVSGCQRVDGGSWGSDRGQGRGRGPDRELILRNLRRIADLLAREVRLLGTKSPIRRLLGTESPIRRLGTESPIRRLLGTESPIRRLLGTESPIRRHRRPTGELQEASSVRGCLHVAQALVKQLSILVVEPTAQAFSFALRAKREEKALSFALRAKREEKADARRRRPGSRLAVQPTGRAFTHKQTTGTDSAKPSAPTLSSPDRGQSPREPRPTVPRRRPRASAAAPQAPRTRKRGLTPSMQAARAREDAGIPRLMDLRLGHRRTP